MHLQKIEYTQLVKVPQRMRQRDRERERERERERDLKIESKGLNKEINKGDIHFATSENMFKK